MLVDANLTVLTHRKPAQGLRGDRASWRAARRDPSQPNPVPQDLLPSSRRPRSISGRMTSRRPKSEQLLPPMISRAPGDLRISAPEGRAPPRVRVKQAVSYVMLIYWLANHTFMASWDTVDQLCFRED